MSARAGKIQVVPYTSLVLTHRLNGPEPRSSGWRKVTGRYLLDDRGNLLTEEEADAIDPEWRGPN